MQVAFFTFTEAFSQKDLLFLRPQSNETTNVKVDLQAA